MDAGADATDDAAGSPVDGSADANDATPSADAEAAHEPDAAQSTSIDAAFELPSNASFETARAVAPGDTWQRVVNDSQVDYYSFEAQAGVFYVLSTDYSSFSPDNAITVYDSERSMVAQNDYGSLYPNDHIDARLIIRPERSGKYYVVIADRVTSTSDPSGRFVPPLNYRFTLTELTSETPGYIMASDDGNPSTLTLQRDEVTDTSYVTIIGELSDDHREASFGLQGMTDRALIGELLAPGVAGDGSTAETITLRVTSDRDKHLLARVDQAKHQTMFHPPVDDGMYIIQLQAGESVGRNGFYAIDVALMRDNPHEQSDADNDHVETAEPITFSGSARRRGLLLSRLPAGDIDYYRFAAEKGQRITLRCEGESGGSGVRGLQAEVLDAAARALDKASEPSAKNLQLDEIEVDVSGTYYLKLSSATPPLTNAEDDAVEPWVRCAVSVAY